MISIAKHIYELGALYDDETIEIDFSPYSESYDWLQIGDMIAGRIPIVETVLSSPKLKFNGRKPLGRDCVVFSSWLLFSERTKRVLESVFEDSLCYVTWPIDGNPYHLILPEIKSEYLDKERSECVTFPSNKNKIMSISKYAFRKDRIKDPSLFRIPERRLIMFATDALKSEFEKECLKGFRFVDYEKPPTDVLIC